jgi:phage terminase large subunit-like protein
VHNRQRAQAVIDFIETLRAPDGAKVGEPIVLRKWQKNHIYDVYSPERPDGRRMVKQAILSMARKNGKTALVAGLCLAHLCGPEAIRNGQLYSVAFDREQAAILFKYMTAMVYMDEELSTRLNVIESRKKIVDPVSGSEFTALSSETKGKHGKSTSFVVFDELAQFGADRELYDVMMTSTGAHAEPLAWVISTQAADDSAVLSELIDYGQRVNEGEIQDSTFKAFIYAVPDDVDIWDESTWTLANPALGDFRSLEEMQETAAKAKRMPTAESTFRNLYLNQRIDAATRFVSLPAWKLCGDDPDFDAFEAFPIHGGLDLSGKNDLTSLILTVQDLQSIIHVRCFFWAPGDNLREKEDRDRVPYCTWRDQGYLIAKDGRTIDYGWVAAQLGEIHADTPIASLRFDRWRIDDLKRELDDLGIPCWIEGKDEPVTGGIKLVPHGQGYKDMSPAVEHVEDAITEGRLRHGNHPVLTMCAANTVVTKDPAGLRKFAKDRSTGRIDGMVALAMALTGQASDVPVKPAAEVGMEVWD